VKNDGRAFFDTKVKKVFHHSENRVRYSKQSATAFSFAVYHFASSKCNRRKCAKNCERCRLAEWRRSKRVLIPVGVLLMRKPELIHHLRNKIQIAVGVVVVVTRLKIHHKLTFERP